MMFLLKMQLLKEIFIRNGLQWENGTSVNTSS